MTHPTDPWPANLAAYLLRDPRHPAAKAAFTALEQGHPTPTRRAILASLTQRRAQTLPAQTLPTQTAARTAPQP